jgi:CSLREA domain-containing protein
MTTWSLPRSPRQPLALCALLLLTAAGAARAAVFTPTKTADTLDGACDRDCSLREAITAANAAPGPDVVVLGSGVYALSRAGAGEDLAATGDLDVTADLVLFGAGAVQTTIDAAHLDRAFDLTGARLEIVGVTVRNGQVAGPGGGLRNRAGELLLTRSVVTGGAASGANGGGIDSDGTLAVIESTLSANSAGGNGGGLIAKGSLTLTNSTVSGNVATGYGGGLYLISDLDGTIANATITNNRSLLQRGGGAFVESAAFIGGAPGFRNSILAGNSATNAPAADRDCSGSARSEGHNLVGIAAGCSSFSVANADLPGTDVSPFDPLLAPLGSYGGPTPTHNLLAGSPAIDTGDPAAPASGGTACEPIDQRGAARPGGARCDIGAVEVTDDCVAGGPTLCLNGGRFRATATWKTPQGASGPAQGVALTDDSGYFWFFDPENVELTVKVLNACVPPFNRFWVFISGLTNLEVTVTVVDTATGTVKTYTNPQGRVFRTRLDTNAFATCP